MAMGPIWIKVYVRLPAAGDTSVSLESKLLANILQPVALWKYNKYLWSADFRYARQVT